MRAGVRNGIVVGAIVALHIEGVDIFIVSFFFVPFDNISIVGEQLILLHRGQVAFYANGKNLRSELNGIGFLPSTLLGELSQSFISSTTLLDS